MSRIATTFLILLLVFLNISLAAYPQEIPVSLNRYTLDGDTVFIEEDESGARHFYAEGNVVLTYIIEGESWILEAGKVEFIEEVDSDGVPVARTAIAEEDVLISGQSISISTPGTLNLDILENRIETDSPDIHVWFPNGKLVTEHLLIYEDSPDHYFVETSISTEATYILSESPLPSAGRTERSGSIFGDLTFDFSEITIETERTRLELIDGEPYRLDCPDTTIVTSNGNTIRLPVSHLTFAPPTLQADNGAELLIDPDIRVSSDLLTLTYPESGGMEVIFTGLCAANPEGPFADQRVVVSHPAGIFSSDVLEILVDENGTHRIHATGCASFEIPLGSIEGISPVLDE